MWNVESPCQNRRITNMCNNEECKCENCTCNPCECTVDEPCGCDDENLVAAI